MLSIDVVPANGDPPLNDNVPTDGFCRAENFSRQCATWASTERMAAAEMRKSLESTSATREN
jgi:hypothetical protein